MTLSIVEVAYQSHVSLHDSKFSHTQVGRGGQRLNFGTLFEYQ